MTCIAKPHATLTLLVTRSCIIYTTGVSRPLKIKKKERRHDRQFGETDRSHVGEGTNSEISCVIGCHGGDVIHSKGRSEELHGLIPH